ncbi:peptidylprolyl isomerase [Clostridium scatologenes]|uniref:Foldase protein PrsA n=1 Tax=Clostridium scatologenes TaxID=1548 RepID=A0A0E3JR02_CLOSL|nr:peptidylprolyl isomerase [Clostridium scatologenes]AKA71354.1 PpiC-type peptidyl-prolyl cis-trans isomerase [Clostridium scatologenes]
MKSVKRLVSAVLISAFAFSTVGCNMIAKTPEAIKNSVVATVNGEKITRGELDSNPNLMGIVAQIKQQYGEDYEKNDDAKSILKEQKSKVLDTMIESKVIEQKAKELKVLPDDAKLKAEVDKQISNLKQQQFGNDTAKFQAALKQQSLTEENLKNMYYTQMRNQEISTNVTNNVGKDVKVDDKSVQDYYKNNPYKFTEKPNRIHTAHILVKTEEEAKKVKARLDKGEDFAKVAKEVSTDTATKDKGGDLGFVNYVDSGFDAGFMAGAIALKKGAVSAPVKSQYGYHIIKCVEKEEYPVKKLDAVKAQIKTQLETEQKQKKYQDKVAEWKKSAKISKNEKNLI